MLTVGVLPASGLLPSAGKPFAGAAAVVKLGGTAVLLGASTGAGVGATSEEAGPLLLGAARLFGSSVTATSQGAAGAGSASGFSAAFTGTSASSQHCFLEGFGGFCLTTGAARSAGRLTLVAGPTSSFGGVGGQLFTALGTTVLLSAKRWFPSCAEKIKENTKKCCMKQQLGLGCTHSESCCLTSALLAGFGVGGVISKGGATALEPTPFPLAALFSTLQGAAGLLSESTALQRKPAPGGDAAAAGTGVLLGFGLLASGSSLVWGEGTGGEAPLKESGLGT